jgi:hypothetical protein
MDADLHEREPMENISRSRDIPYWAQPVSKLKVQNIPGGAINLNVDGRQVVSPIHGFGPVWQKTYRMRLSGIDASPAEVIKSWKANFQAFQPPENRFIPTLAGIQPGEVVLINATVSGFPVATGMLVLYADDESFTLMTPEGHPESGWNTFSAYEEEGSTVAQVQSLARSTDPLFELGFRLLGGAKQQEKIWQHVLESLAAYFGVRGQVQYFKVLIDPRFQWSQAKNVWKNAIVRSFFYQLAAPLRWAGRSPRN